jgi:phosphatidylglycerol:prolipoprotein diacylglycerol transferase
MYPVLFQIGNFEIRAYGIIVALSFFVALWLGTKEARGNGLESQTIQDFALYALIGGLIGARLYFVLFSQPAYFLEHPWEIVAIWQGGIGVIGSLIGGFVVALWYCWTRGISLLSLGDTLAPGIALGQTVGQLACLLNGDSWGKPTNLPWAIIYTDPRSMAPLNIPLHPIEIYEMIAYFFVFLIVWWVRGRTVVRGYVFLSYLAGYGIARFIVEFFRGDPAIFAWGIPAAQVFGVVMVLASIGLFFSGCRAERFRLGRVSQIWKNHRHEFAAKRKGPSNPID